MPVVLLVRSANPGFALKGCFSSQVGWQAKSISLGSADAFVVAWQVDRVGLWAAAPQSAHERSGDRLFLSHFLFFLKVG